MFTVTISFVDTSNPKRKRFDRIIAKVEKPTREAAWKLVCDTQRKASNTPTIALINISVNGPETYWSLH